MTSQDYREKLAQEQKELANLEAAQRKIEQEILRRRRIIASLIELIKDSDQRNSEIIKKLAESWYRYNADQGLTDDIRKIIRSAGTFGIRKMDIRSELSKLGRSIEDHVNPAGTINSIIKRLVEQGEIQEATDPTGFFAVVIWKDFDLISQYLKAFNEGMKKDEK